MDRRRLADRWQVLNLKAAKGALARCAAVSRLGSVELSSGELSIWIQVRAGSWVESKEGRFYLREGDWIAFAKDSAPTIQADQNGICIGLTVAEEALRIMSRFSDFGLYVGRGRLAPPDLRATARLWYRVGQGIGAGAGATGRIQAPLRSLLLHLQDIQGELRSTLMACPGSSLARKRQVFERLQRARLYLEGHCHRIVSIAELAKRTQFSTWYFSKIFLRLYGETPQLACSRMRLGHAANLLASTAMTIGEVGNAAGFDNSCSFARSFRARFGMTASEFRNTRQWVGQIPQRRSLSVANHMAGAGYALR
jgi:AraC family transcriptional regulator